MAIELPQPRLPKAAVPKLLDWGSDQKAPQGGAFQRLNRIGSRFSLDISYTRLKPEPDARILARRLRRAKTEGALFPVPQPGLQIGNPGNPVVDGGGQSGSSIAIRGFAPGYAVREGQFFSIIDGGRRYLHCASGDAVAGGDGRLVLAIHPMLRVRPANGAICEFAKPYIEGIVGGPSIDVELTIARAQVPTITITERK
jgi:hypothetical protein